MSFSEVSVGVVVKEFFHQFDSLKFTAEPNASSSNLKHFTKAKQLSCLTADFPLISAFFVF
ncbi:MAG: hypothetical protein ACXITV_09155 [Luteibaculaceae bacterium]